MYERNYVKVMEMRNLVSTNSAKYLGIGCTGNRTVSEGDVVDFRFKF